MRKLLSKKVHGGAEIIAAIVGIFLLIVLFVALFYVDCDYYRKNDIHRVHRSYLLDMEREGYLTAANKTSLVNELEKIGCQNIVITANDTPVGYGNKVTLKIECDIKTTRLKFNNSDAEAESVLKHVSYKKSGTALY